MATILIVLGCLLAPVSVLAVWVASEVSNTSRYVATMEPLARDPAIQNALTERITTEITTRLNVTGYADQAAATLSSRGLPKVGAELRAVAPSIASGVAGFVRSEVHKIVTGPRFARAWVQANTVVHQELVKALSGQGPSSVSVKNGQVVVSLGPLINLVKQDLVRRGFTLVSKIPAVNPTLTLFSAKYLVKAQSAYRRINDLKIVLPILTLLLLALGVYVARGRRRALVGAGLGLAASMLVPAVGLFFFRGIYLGSVPPSVLPADAAAALFDTLVRFIKQGLRTVLVVGLVVAAGAFLAGPSVTAVRIRAAFAHGLGRVRSGGEHAGLRTGPAGTWTYSHRGALRISAVALAALVFAFWAQPTAIVAIVITVLLLVAIGLIELIGRPPPAPAPSPPVGNGK
ncbi:MAG: hypothetical protein ACLPN6_20185 [Streptosporangiaceae bacterium]|nr:hypothetical protein [Actinomycetota bacterium]